MTIEHALAMLGLFIVFGLSLFIKRVLMDLVLIGYVSTLIYMTLTDITGWELIFFPVNAGIGIIAIIMLWNHATKGDLI